MTTTPEPERVRADNGALRKEIEALRGLLAAQRAELTTARAQGERSMRDAVLRWHGERLIYYRGLSGTNGIAGAYMTAHEQSIAAISTLNVDKGG